MAGCERAEPIGLLLDGGNDAGMLVTEVGEDQLRAEVQVAAAVGIDDVASGAADEVQDVARPLHRPRMKNQLVEIHDAFRLDDHRRQPIERVWRGPRQRAVVREGRRRDLQLGVSVHAGSATPPHPLAIVIGDGALSRGPGVTVVAATENIAL